MRARAGRLLQWHQLKQVGGLLIAAVTFELPGLGPKLASMPTAQVAQTLGTLSMPADKADQLKRRGLFVDMDRSGRILEPSEITEAEVSRQLARARQAAVDAMLNAVSKLRNTSANGAEDADVPGELEHPVR